MAMIGDYSDTLYTTGILQAQRIRTHKNLFEYQVDRTYCQVIEV